ncbi:MAG: DUF3311 domain-containing protein [Nakamurella sp.]
MTSDPHDPQSDQLEHPVDEGGQRGKGPNDIRASWWNALLLLPLLMLVTSIYNKQGPELFGLPFFYWFQFVFVFVGVGCVWIVYIKTKHISRRTGGPKK